MLAIYKSGSKSLLYKVFVCVVCCIACLRVYSEGSSLPDQVLEKSNASTNLHQIKSNLPNIGTNLNVEETQVLMLLSQRRNKILEYESELANKAVMLQAIERNLEKKIQDLQTLTQKMEEANLVLDAKEDLKIKSLVKIYENMNPRRAAQIFDEIELDTLVHIVCAMKEIKVSAILANMDIAKAKELSVALTKRSTRIRSTDD